jgi:2-oxoglutarate/2-oxoacid ferredoxin oxidoreductase subunit alpha
LSQQIVVGAPAGLGVMSAGLILSKTLLKSGFEVYDYQEYPSLIKGGNNSYFINFDEKPVRSAKQKIDVLVCLDKLTYDLHVEKMEENGVVIYNSNKINLDDKQSNVKIKLIPIPASDLAKKLNAPEITVNNLLLGAVCKLINLDLNILNEYISKQFDEKHKDLVDENLATVKAGFDYIKESVEIPARNASQSEAGGRSKSVVIVTNKNKVMLTGNEAIALATISANCQFYAAYPMTPSSAILHILASHQKETGMIVKHPEDEISAINMAIGASYTGVRAATGTSGGGYALMVEAISMAGITEVPVVVFMGMRTGPSTGLPTWTGQGDLNFIVNTSHGEFPRVVIAPGDNEEMFYLTRRAFNAADLLQTPVFILFDKMLGESHEGIELNEEGEHQIPVLRFLNNTDLNKSYSSNKSNSTYHRYSLSGDTTTERSIPGQEGGQSLTNSYEHDEFGFATENAEMTRSQMEKRMKKYDLIFEHREELGLRMTKYFGAENPDLLIVSWGSNKGAIRDAIDSLPDKKIGFLQIVCVEPIDTDTIKKYLKTAKKIVGIEGNYQGQMMNLIQSKTGVEIPKRLLKYDGRQFLVDEIVEFIQKQY